jgi:asparagine synthase (glutamine-hydrolysing)
MQGIFGVIGAAPRTGSEILSGMLDSTTHGSLGHSAVYINEELSVCAGWTSHRESSQGCFPILNEMKDVCLIFAGETFPDAQEIEGLHSRGHDFEQGDAAYVVHLFEELGLRSLARLNGRFSGVLLDFRERKVTLFNDRYGLGRIYYHQNQEGFFFSSQAKALLRVLPETRKFDERSLAEFCSCGCVLQNRTLFKHISILPGGAEWTFSKGEPLKRRVYFDRSTWENQSPLRTEDYYQNLKATFRAVVPRYLQAQQPIGISLTGGLDSRMILAWARQRPGAFPCYTFGGSYRECADVSVARTVAKTCHQPHSVIAVGTDFITEFPRLAEEAIRVSDGTMDVTGSVEIYANRAARQIAPVRVTGSYGSEVLRRNVAFKPQAFNRELFDDDFASLVAEVPAIYQEEAAVPRASFIAFKQVPWHHYPRLAVEESQITVRTPFLDNALVELSFRAPPALANSAEPSLRLIADGNPSLNCIPTDRGLCYTSTSVFTRLRRYYEYLRFKAEYAYDYGMPQWMAKVDASLAKLRLERLFLGHHKFYHFRVWYRDMLAGFVQDILLDDRTRTRSYLCGSRIEKMVNSHVTGRANYTSEITQLLTLELIQRQLIEQN